MRRLARIIYFRPLMEITNIMLMTLDRIKFSDFKKELISVANKYINDVSSLNTNQTLGKKEKMLGLIKDLQKRDVREKSNAFQVFVLSKGAFKLQKDPFLTLTINKAPYRRRPRRRNRKSLLLILLITISAITGSSFSEGLMTFIFAS